MLEDTEIIELYNSRNEDAIARTDEKYGKLCFTIAKNILNDEMTSAECVNDTYLKTWDSIPPQLPRSLRAFLCTITRNIAFDRYKIEKAQRRGKGEITIVLDEMNEIVTNGETPDDALDKIQTANIINDFLRSLPERERLIFMRRYFFADTVKTIAQGCALSENNVNVILYRCRSKLKEMLEKEGISI